MIYTSINNQKIKEIAKLKEKKNRDKSNLFLVEGEHIVEEAYKCGIIKELILKENEKFKLDVDTIFVNDSVLKYISNLQTPPSIMAICQKFENNNIGDRLLILDDIQDPGNLGTIIRSAVAFNIDTIVLSNDTVDLYNDKVIRSTQGLMFHMNFIRCDIKEFILQIKNNNYVIYGTKINGGILLKNIVAKPKKFAIIMGNEGRGVQEQISLLCDENIYIDMNEVCESLNVAVATSIILYEFNK